MAEVGSAMRRFDQNVKTAEVGESYGFTLQLHRLTPNRLGLKKHAICEVLTIPKNVPNTSWWFQVFPRLSLSTGKVYETTREWRL